MLRVSQKACYFVHTVSNLDGTNAQCFCLVLSCHVVQFFLCNYLDFMLKRTLAIAQQRVIYILIVAGILYKFKSKRAYFLTE